MSVYAPQNLGGRNSVCRVPVPVPLLHIVRERAANDGAGELHVGGGRACSAGADDHDRREPSTDERNREYRIS